MRIVVSLPPMLLITSLKPPIQNEVIPDHQFTIRPEPACHTVGRRRQRNYCRDARGRNGGERRKPSFARGSTRRPRASQCAGGSGRANGGRGMIRPLRQRHCGMVIVLGVVLPIAFTVGIAARKPVPDMISLPKELVTSRQKFAATEWERADLFTKTPIQVRLLRESAGAGHFAVEFSAAKDFVKPDLIVYWVTGNPNSHDALPDNAGLLGAFNPSSALPLPREAGSASGVLVLYSLADHVIV